MGAIESLWQTLLYSADVAGLAALVLMAMLSAHAGAQTEAGDKLPLFWTLRGQPHHFATARTALMVGPIVATICLMLLAFLARQQDHQLSDSFVGLALWRVGLSISLILGHGLYVVRALRHRQK